MEYHVACHTCANRGEETNSWVVGDEQAVDRILEEHRDRADHDVEVAAVS